MANNIRTSVNAKPLEERSKRFIASVVDMLSLPPSTPESAITAIAMEAAAYAPSAIEEIEKICFGDEGKGGIHGGTIIYAKPNKKGKIPNWKTGRISFMRSPGMYIKEAILEDAKLAYVYRDGNFIGYKFGNLGWLNANTKFSYINKTKGKSYENTTPYGMFAAFEFGTSALGWGNIYPVRGKWLSPTDDSIGPKLDHMIKTIHPYEMYSHINKLFVREIIAAEIRKVRY